jgi:hypothetical protein
VDDDACRFPIATLIVSVVSVTPPDVVMRASAKRVFPLHLLTITTRVWSAVLSINTRSASALAWSRVSNWDEAIVGRGVCAITSSGRC